MCLGSFLKCMRTGPMWGKVGHSAPAARSARANTYHGVAVLQEITRPFYVSTIILSALSNIEKTIS
jgi:hypothetical protein